MARIGTRLVSLMIDTVEYKDQVSGARITSAESDSDFTSFADAAAGGARDYALVMTVAQDAETGSLWSEIFDNVGDTVPFVYAPYGNAVASATEPHFQGSAIIQEPDGDLLGGDADRSTTAVMTVEVTWPLTGRPTKVTV